MRRVQVVAGAGRRHDRLQDGAPASVAGGSARGPASGICVVVCRCCQRRLRCPSESSWWRRQPGGGGPATAVAGDEEIGQDSPAQGGKGARHRCAQS
eukprot:5058230-Prymnesium_polylepis.2